MKKGLKKVMTLTLALSMAVSGNGTYAAKADEPDIAAPKATEYNAYTSFQLGGYWLTRTIWNDKTYGRDDIRSKQQLSVSGKKYNYQYAKQYVAFNAGDTAVNDGGIKDAVMTENGEYTLQMNKLPVTSHKNSGGEAWNWLCISTDIPLSVKDVKCTDVKVYLDGSSKPFAELAQAPYNQEGNTNGGCYCFYIFDVYSDGHKTEGVLDSTKYTKFPKKSLKITYSISGLNFDKPKEEVAVQNGKMAGQKITANGVTYKITERSMSDGTKGKVQVIGATGKKVTIASQVKDGDCAYRVTSLSTKAFAGNKTVKSVKLSDGIKKVPAKAFTGCTALQSVTLGSKTKAVKKAAFANCKKLAKLTVYQKVRVTKNAFVGCKKKIHVSGLKKYTVYTKAQIKKSGYSKVQ